jgi:hypothetical protein
MSNKNVYPALSKLAEVMLATPATQVSVERLFSVVAFIVNSHRTNLSKRIVDDIIVLKMNDNLV